jgi:hypothetical protein
MLTEVSCDFRKIKIDSEVVFSKEPFKKLDRLKLVLFWRSEIPVFNTPPSDPSVDG